MWPRGRGPEVPEELARERPSGRSSTGSSSWSPSRGSASLGCPYWSWWPTSVRTSCATSIATWPSSAASIPKRWRCSGRESSALWPPLSGRKPRRWGRPGRCGLTTSSSRATGSTVSPTAAASTRSQALRLWRGTAPLRVGPAGARHRDAVHRRRRPGAARHRLRPRHQARRRQVGRRGLLRRRRGQRGRRRRGLRLRRQYAAPVVFFCQNNQWAISEPVRLQSRRRLAQRGQGYGIPGIQVDGNDVLAVHAATRLALARAVRRRRTDARRGGHLPDGPAHDLRRPDPVPLPRRGG